MKFIDEAIITVESGTGGRGCVSFRRERFVPRGGPNGGDGGNGGDVVLKATSRMRTLYEFRHKKHLKAGNGAHGQGKCKAGKKGHDVIIEIPQGTLISDAETGEQIADLTKSGQTFILLKAGRGGKGNARFKTSTNRAPRHAQPGESGQKRVIKFDLKLLADVGIIGLPNAGKSTLITAISAARPKIDSYPFTTLTPSLGVVRTRWGEPFVVADIPGLIKGAHKGVGLGTQFLKHIERTTLLLHLIDASAIEESDPLAAYNTINKELSMYNRYSSGIIVKPQIVVLSKLDIPKAEKGAELFQSAFKGSVSLISSANGQGIDALISQIDQKLTAPHTS